MALRLWQDQPGSRLLAGSTRQQAVGRINQVAGCGHGDEDENENEDVDEDEDEDEIHNYAVLLTASVERFCVSSVQDFCC